MAYEQKDGSGALFRNDKKGNDRAPDYRGDCNVGGQIMEIAAWIKEGQKGKFMSLSFKPKGEKQFTGGAASKQDEFDDDCPF